MPPKSKDSFPEALKPYRFHGIFPRTGPYVTSGDDYVSDCPFCGKEGSFVVNSDSGQFVCHSKPTHCGKVGNTPVFLKNYAATCAERITGFWLKRLSQRRSNVPVEAFRGQGIGYDPQTKRYTIPIYNERDQLQDLRVYNSSGKKMGTAGCSAGCWNLNKAAKFKKGNDATIYVCEGEHDGIALQWLLTKLKKKDFVVVGIPGANTVKDNWVRIWARFATVVIIGDNDSPGDVMAEKIWSKLSTMNYAGDIRYVNWPDTLPEGHDVTNHIGVGLEANHTRRKIWTRLEALISSKHRRMPFDGQGDLEASRGGERERVERPKSNPTLKETLAKLSKYVKLTDHHALAFQFCASIYLATQWDDDPVWGYLVGSPGSGKSLLLCSFADGPEANFYSSMQSKQLVSGFKTDPDPSLIPKMIGRCSIFKDWTELISGNPLALEDTNAVLRGWFDGEVMRTFGNGEVRHYVGRGNILAGVTNAIHGLNDSTLGERFLKFQLPKPTRTQANEIIMSAMLSTTKERERSEVMRKAVLDFVNRDMPEMDPQKHVCTSYLKRISALATLVALLRAKVEYSGMGFDRELSYRPEEELPTRLGKQLVKLAMANCVVMGRPRVDEAVYRLVERTAFNTAHGFHLDIIEAMMRQGGKAILLDDVSEESRVPTVTMRRRLDDLELLNVVNKSTIQKTGLRGRTAIRYTVAKSVRALWEQAQVRENHLTEALAARAKKEKDE